MIAPFRTYGISGPSGFGRSSAVAGWYSVTNCAI